MHSQALARAGPWAEALEPGPWPLGGSWALGPGLGPGRRALCAGPAAAWAQARAQGPGAQGMPTAQGPASSTDADALALIHDDAIIHISVVPNPVMCLFDS